MGLHLTGSTVTGLSNAFAGSLTATAVKTSAYSAAVGDLVPVDATGGAVTVTLPTAPADRTRVAVKKIDSSANVVTVSRGGSSDVFNKAGGSTSLTLTLVNQAMSLQYSGGIWYVVGDDLPLSGLDARFLSSAQIATVSPESYGAVGDGTTDDTAALQAAVATGRSVSLRKDKTYLVSGPLNLSGQKLLGNGATLKRAAQVSTTTTTSITANTTITLTVASTAGFRAGQTITVVNGGTFDTSPRVIGSVNPGASTITTTTGIGITVSGTSTVYVNGNVLNLTGDALVDDVKIDGNKANWTFYRWQTTAEIVTTNDRNVVRGVYSNNAPGEGAIVFGNYNVIRDSWFTNLNGNGVHFSGAIHPVCDNVTVISPNLDVNVGHSDGCIIWSNSITHATVVNCYMENGISGIGSIDSTDNSDCTIIGNTIVNPTTTAMDLIASEQAQSRLVITGNRIYLNANTPLTVSNTNGSPTVFPNQIIFTGNYLSGPAGASLVSMARIKKVTIEGNHFDLGTATTGTGLSFSSTQSDGVSIRNNSFTGGNYGVVIASPRVSISGNHFYNQFTGAINIGAASQSMLVSDNFLTNDATASSSYDGIIVRDRVICRGNYVDLTQGRSGINAQTNAVVKDNTVRKGTATYTIRVDVGQTGVILKDNEVTTASSIAGTATETGTIVIP